MDKDKEFKEELKQFLLDQSKRSRIYFNNTYNGSGNSGKYLIFRDDDLEQLLRLISDKFDKLDDKERKMKLYKIKVKEYGFYGYYTDFIVLGNSINDMLENLYNELFPEKTDIPYYLRSSNFEITCLGEFIPDGKVKKLNNILCSNYLTED